MESELINEITEEKRLREEKCETEPDFPKEKWQPVSIDEIYKDLPEVKRWHNDYCSFWLRNKNR